MKLDHLSASNCFGTFGASIYAQVWRSAEEHHRPEKAYPLGSLEIFETHSTVKAFSVMHRSHFSSGKNRTNYFFFRNSGPNNDRRDVVRLLVYFIWTV